MFTEDDEYSENEDAPPLTSPPPPPPPPPPQKTYAAFNYPPPPAVEPPASRPSVKPVPTGDEAHPGASRSLGAARRCVEHFMGDGDAELEAALAAHPTRRGRGGRALDETTLQQLRAIFAANDADGAEALDEAQLKGAIEMLGLIASRSRSKSSTTMSTLRSRSDDSRPGSSTTDASDDRLSSRELLSSSSWQ